MNNNDLVKLFNAIDPREYMGLQNTTKSTPYWQNDCDVLWAVVMPENHDHFFNGLVYGVYKNPIAIFREKAWAYDFANKGGFEVIQL